MKCVKANRNLRAHLHTELLSSMYIRNKNIQWQDNKTNKSFIHWYMKRWKWIWVLEIWNHISLIYLVLKEMLHLHQSFSYDSVSFSAISPFVLIIIITVSKIDWNKKLTLRKTIFCLNFKLMKKQIFFYLYFIRIWISLSS